MNAVHAGAASTPPCAFDLIFCGRSRPIQTPATRSAVYPMYQTSVPSFVVPVFPADGTRKPDAHTAPLAVPRITTSFIMSTMSHASSGESTVACTDEGSHRISPRAFSTRMIAYGDDRMPKRAKVVNAATISIG